MSDMTSVITLMPRQIGESTETYDTPNSCPKEMLHSSYSVGKKGERTKLRKTKKGKSNTGHLCGWLISINHSNDDNPARFCSLGRIGSLTYNNVRSLLKNPNLDDEGYIRLLEDIAMVKYNGCLRMFCGGGRC